MTWRVFLAFCVLQFFHLSYAHAQDRGALQAAGLFQQSCLRFAGRADLLRGWISDHHLPSIPPDDAFLFAGGHSAMGYGASTPDGKMVLVSNDDGACSVVVEFGNLSSVEQALTSILAQSGVAISEVFNRGPSTDAATQRIYWASLGARRWVLSVTSQAHSDAPLGTQPEIILLATVDNGGPLLGPQLNQTDFVLGDYRIQAPTSFSPLSGQPGDPRRSSYLVLMIPASALGLPPGMEKKIPNLEVVKLSLE